MQIILHPDTLMDLPIGRTDYPVTPESIASALEYQLSERQKASAKLGIKFTPEGHAFMPAPLALVPKPIETDTPLDVRCQVAECMDPIVEIIGRQDARRMLDAVGAFGIPVVRRYLDLLDAMNEGTR